MKESLHDKFIPMKEPANKLSDVITELENPDYELHDNEYYSELFVLYNYYIGIINSHHAYLLMEVTNEQV